MAVRELCRAKVNLHLDVVGRRADGYHDLVTVFHEIDLHDDLEAAVGEAPGQVTIEVEGGGPDVPRDARNLAVRAARLLADGGDRGVALRLVKRIPAGGGLGGGSADAAGALRAVNRLLGLGRTAAELETLALEVGSDVPFLVRGGTCLARGRGEILEPVPAARFRILLLTPSFGVSTAAVYAALPRPLPPPRDPAPLLRALAAGDADALGAALWNALEPAAVRVEPRLAPILDGARALLGPRVLLSGSGSTVFAVLRDDAPPPLAALRTLPAIQAVDYR